MKRQLAEGRLKIADMQVKVAKAATPLKSVGAGDVKDGAASGDAKGVKLPGNLKMG